MSVPDEVYSRNVSCAHILIFMFYQLTGNALSAQKKKCII